MLLYSLADLVFDVQIQISVLDRMRELCSKHMCVFVVLCGQFYFFFIFFFTLDARLLARSQYSEGPATGHLDTGFSWFPCVYKNVYKKC